MKNTLLIDDDFDHLVGLAVALVEAGHQVIPKIDADSAIAVVRGDALVEAVYKPNTLQGIYEDDWVIEKMSHSFFRYTIL